MEESNFMMALLIPGLSFPSKDFDVFLQPLVDELWTCGRVSMHTMLVVNNPLNCMIWLFGAYMIIQH